MAPAIRPGLTLAEFLARPDSRSSVRTRRWGPDSKSISPAVALQNAKNAPATTPHYTSALNRDVEMTLTQQAPPSLYEADFVAWSDQMATLLGQQRFDELDLPHLIEEVQDLGNRHRDALESTLIVLLLHLLKWQYQPQHLSGSWKGSIVEHRRRVNKALSKYPSLKPYLQQIFDDCYQDAVEQAIAETGLDSTTFPQRCPFMATQVLDTQFFPSWL